MNAPDWRAGYKPAPDAGDLGPERDEDDIEGERRQSDRSRSYSTPNGLAVKSAPVRPLKTPKRGPNGMILEPEDSDIETLIEEAHNLMRWALKANYADEAIGDGNTYDPTGRYVCGGCNQIDRRDCAFWDIMNLDPEAASCRSWERVRACDPEVRFWLPDGGAASFGTAKNGVGFGCTRCWKGTKAKRGPDSEGRAVWCGEAGCRVAEKGCCEFNGAEVLANDGSIHDSRQAKRRAPAEARA